MPTADTGETQARAAPEKKEKKLLKWFVANLEEGSGNEHRILVSKDGKLLPGEKWRAAIPVGLGGFVILTILTLLLLSMSVVLAILCFGLLIFFGGTWQKCFLRVEEREVAVLFRKDYVYGFLRPGWYLILRIFNLERVAYTVDRSRRETWDLEVTEILTKDNLQVGFDLVLTREVRSLHELAPEDVYGPDGKVLFKKGEDVLPWDFQGPYLAHYRYKEGELWEDVVTAAKAVAFLSCFGRTWSKIQEYLTKPEPEEKVEAKPEEPKAEKDGEEGSFISRMTDSLDKLLIQAGFRLTSVRVKNIKAPPELTITATEQFKGQALLRQIEGVVAALNLLKEKGGVADPVSFLLTRESIEAFRAAAPKAGAVIVGTTKDLLQRLEIQLPPRGGGAKTEAEVVE